MTLSSAIVQPVSMFCRYQNSVLQHHLKNNSIKKILLLNLEFRNTDTIVLFT